ncbi:hypothetical protein ACFLVK_00730 [Chloroflexota bacterium]
MMKLVWIESRGSALPKWDSSVGFRQRAWGHYRLPIQMTLGLPIID